MLEATCAQSLTVELFWLYSENNGKKRNRWRTMKKRCI